jgi:hypothetical protein
MRLRVYTSRPTLASQSATSCCLAVMAGAAPAVHDQRSRGRLKTSRTTPHPSFCTPCHIHWRRAAPASLPPSSSSRVMSCALRRSTSRKATCSSRCSIRLMSCCPPAPLPAPPRSLALRGVRGLARHAADLTHVAEGVAHRRLHILLQARLHKLELVLAADRIGAHRPLRRPCVAW